MRGESGSAYLPGRDDVPESITGNDDKVLCSLQKETLHIWITAAGLEGVERGATDIGKWA